MVKISFRSSDGVKLVGILEKPKLKTKTCIIVCHGRTGNKNEKGLVLFANSLINVGFAIFRFDFRSHGESGGRDRDMTVAGEEKDLKAAYRLLLKKGYNRFGIAAASFAGAPASFFTPKHQAKVKALALLFPRLDFIGYYRKWIGSGERRLLDKQGFINMDNRFKGGKRLFDEALRIKPVKELAKLKIPILFVHGDKDSSVPYADSVKYSKKLKAKLVTIKGGDHLWLEDDRKRLSQVIKATAGFFLENLS